MKLEKSKWRKVKFGDVVYEDKKTVDAKSSGLERYIAGEHMNTEDLHLRSWGIIGEDYLGPAFHRKFEKGDLLYGSRRTYLKKVAIADFDGITSNTTFVLKENKDIVVSGFIPFLMLSDRFTEHSVKHSKGSVNPYINFKDLAKFEFLLPPIDQQEKLAELLWAGDDLIQKKLKEINQLRLTHSIVIDNLIFESDFKYMPIKNIAIPELKGFVDGDWIESKDQSNSGIRLIQLADIGVRSFINKSRRFISEETLNKLKCFELFAGDILIARMPDPIGRSCILPEIDFRAITAVDVCIIRPNLKLHNPKYWEYVFNTSRWFNLMNQFASGTTRSRVSKKNLEMIEMPTPTLDEQNKLVNQLNSFEIVNGFSDDNLNKLKVIQYQLINSLFE